MGYTYKRLHAFVRPERVWKSFSDFRACTILCADPVQPFFSNCGLIKLFDAAPAATSFRAAFTSLKP